MSETLRSEMHSYSIYSLVRERERSLQFPYTLLDNQFITTRNTEASVGHKVPENNCPGVI